MAYYWVQLQFRSREYLVDLKQVSSFVIAPNGHISFWLPNSNPPQKITCQSRSPTPGYRPVAQYIHQLAQEHDHHWLRFTYDYQDYWVNLRALGSSCRLSVHDIRFLLPDNGQEIVISKITDGPTFERLHQFLHNEISDRFPDYGSEQTDSWLG